MTYGGAALNYDHAAAVNREQQMEDIASVWAVLVAMDDLPATSESREALNQARCRFQLKLDAAGVTETELWARLEHLAAPRPQLRAVPDD